MRQVGLLAISLLAGVLLLVVSQKSSSAQESCDENIARTRLATSHEICRNVNTDWACYGHVQVRAEPTELRFDRSGAQAKISQLKSVDTVSDAGTFIMRVDAVPDPLKLLVFGNAELTPRGENMFFLRTDGDRFVCEESPPGMVIRTESGKRSRIVVNGVTIRLRSAVYITLRAPRGISVPAADPLREMVVTNFEGRVTVSIPGEEAVDLEVGEQVRVHVEEEQFPVSIFEPEPGEYFEERFIQWIATDPEGLRRVEDPLKPTDSSVIPCGDQFLSYGDALTDEISQPSQECLYNFFGQAGDVVTIGMAAEQPEGDAARAGSGLGSQRDENGFQFISYQVRQDHGTRSQDDPEQTLLDPWLDLRDVDGKLLASSDDRSINSADSLIRAFMLPETSVYQIVARAKRNESVGRFRLTFSGGEPTPTATATRCVPYAPAGWVPYRVVQGDTLSGIASRGRTTVRRLMQVNCLTSTVIRIGQRLFVPFAASITPRASTHTVTSTPSPTRTGTWTPTSTSTSTPASSVRAGGEGDGAGLTVTPIATGTNTPTPIWTATATSTPAATATPTATDTPSPTPTNTLTPILPDLMIQISSFSVACQAGDCFLTVSGTVSNRGETGVPGPVQVRISGDQVPSQTITVTLQTFSSPFTVRLGPGGNCFDPDCTVNAVVDPNRLIQESNEQNNTDSSTRLG